MKGSYIGAGVLMVVVLAGCTLKPIYNNLYWLVPWYIEDYVSLREGQDDHLREDLKSFVKAHREQQVPRYIDFLTSLDPYVDGIDEAQVWQLYGQVESFWEQLKQMLAPDIENFLLSLDAQQQQQLFENLAQANSERREQLRDTEGGAAQRYRDRAESLVDAWIGSLSPPQEALLEEYLRELGEGDDGWLDNRERWQRALYEALQSPQPSARIRELLLNNRALWSEDYQREVDRRRALTAELISDLSYTLTPSQKSYLRERLEELVGNFAAL
ncbi:DUF6279 family lipoprotein [Aestuariirhabdus sp. LZHN29]|uniref:DUF6279 family lipoprotein n=1 Tax=Aestuariirhabdus sp. LZHN29 TaxID=3417462 RepID=UPI003CF78AAA